MVSTVCAKTYEIIESRTLDKPQNIMSIYFYLPRDLQFCSVTLEIYTPLAHCTARKITLLTPGFTLLLPASDLLLPGQSPCYLDRHDIANLFSSEQEKG